MMRVATSGRSSPGEGRFLWLEQGGLSDSRMILKELPAGLLPASADEGSSAAAAWLPWPAPASSSASADCCSMPRRGGLPASVSVTSAWLRARGRLASGCAPAVMADEGAGA